MKTKLTLSVDKDLVNFARQHAQSNHTSVSGMFSDFISDHKLHAKKTAVPTVSSMVGSLKGYDINDSKTAIRSIAMPKNIVIDLNVILDVLLKRRGYEASCNVLELQKSPSYNLYISAHAVTTFAYLLEHANVPQVEVLRQINWLLGTFSVIATTNDILKAAVQSRITDYEDAVVEQAAIACKASMIITRNIKDYKNSAVEAIKPEATVDF